MAEERVKIGACGVIIALTLMKMHRKCVESELSGSENGLEIARGMVHIIN